MALYTETVMDHFMHPRNVGEIENPDGVGQVGNAKCGDIMKMYLKIRDNVIQGTFTKKVLDDLNYPAFVLCQLDAKNKVFAVRMCKSSEQRGYKFSKPKGEQKATVSITNKNLVDPIRAAMEGVWQSDKRYRVRGFWVADAKTMCFDLSEGVQEDYRNAASDNESEE